MDRREADALDRHITGNYGEDSVPREIDYSDAQDGSVYELGDGRTIRVKVETDPDAQVNDWEVYGTTEKYSHRYTDGEGNSPRPSEFDGNAEKIECGQGLWIWWQPPKDGPKRGTEEFRKFRSHVQDLLTWGFHIVTVELCEGEDAYGRPIVQEVASLGGVDSIDGKYVGEIVTELVAEVMGSHRRDL